jgi:hypothetical protein
LTTLDNSDFDHDFSETAFADALKQALLGIKRGAEHASEYHRLMEGILTFLFYPNLVYPKVEQALHGGRKRIDIAYTNWATTGFFAAIKTAPQTKARYVVVECKNYSENLGNPEFDQLTGRFGPMRGMFGLICCRENSNPQSIKQRSKDAALDQRGVVIVLDDSDISQMLDDVGRGERVNTLRMLEQRYREVAF